MIKQCKHLLPEAQRPVRPRAFFGEDIHKKEAAGHEQ
jgi:hypothetical protein